MAETCRGHTANISGAKAGLRQSGSNHGRGGDGSTDVSTAKHWAGTPREPVGMPYQRQTHSWEPGRVMEALLCSISPTTAPWISEPGPFPVS